MGRILNPPQVKKANAFRRRSAGQSPNPVLHAPGGSPRTSVAAFATRRRDGLTGVMLINKDPKTAANVQVTLNGAQSGTEGLRFEYGPEQVKANAPMTKTNLTGLGSSFPVAVPAYSIVDLLLLPPK